MQLAKLLISSETPAENRSTLRPKPAIIQVQLLQGLVLRYEELGDRVVMPVHLVVLVEPEVVPGQIQPLNVLANLQGIEELIEALDVEAVLREVKVDEGKFVVLEELSQVCHRLVGQPRVG